MSEPHEATTSDPLPAPPGGSLPDVDLPPPPAALDSEPAPSPGRRSTRTRRIAVGVLVVVTTLALFASVVAIWSYRQVLNTDVFTGRVDDILADPDVQDGLATYVTDEIMGAIDPGRLASEFLPPIAQPLVPVLTSAIERLVFDTTLDVLANQTFQDFLVGAIRRAHGAAVKLLEGETVRGFEIQGDSVILNTLPVINNVLQRLGERGIFGRQISFPPLADDTGAPSQQLEQVAQRLGRELPADFGQITVFTSDSLEEAQQALRLLRRGIVLLLIVTLVLLVVTLVLSPNRWRTAAQLGLGFAVVMLALVVIARWIDREVRELVINPDAVPTVAAVSSEFIGSLESVAVALLVVGLVVAGLGFLFGRSDSATRLRAATTRTAGRAGGLSRGPVSAFVAGHADGLRVLAVAAGAIVLVLSGLTLSGAVVAVVVTAILLLLVAVARRRVGQATGVEAEAPVPPPSPATPPG